MTARATHERLREVLNYDPATGFFTWAKDRNRLRAGSLAGHIKTRGYRGIGIDGRYYFAHRVAWNYMTGDWPTGDIDHVDGNKLNNAWSNLRQVTEHENLQNQKRAHRNNKAGLLGVCSLPSGRFQARIRIQGRDTSLGLYATAEEAHVAYINAKREHHPGNTL